MPQRPVPAHSEPEDSRLGGQPEPDPGLAPYEAGGRTCLCHGGPKCRHDHRLKQHPSWHVDQRPDGTFRWTTPAGRTYTAEPTRYPV